MNKNKKKHQKQIFLERVKCGCVAQKHQLINNCLSCGKVVCAQQGEGPCLYCGNLVVKPQGQYISNDDSLFPTLNKEQLNKVSQERSKAILHKNTLVERDKSNNLGQNIYDEHTDYYDASQNQWLDEEDRKKAVDKLLQRDKFIEEEQFKQRVIFDPISGQFITQELANDDDEFRKQGKQFMKKAQKKSYEEKLEKAKNNWDTRMLKNDKIQQLVEVLKKPNSNPSKPPKQNNLTKMVVEDDQQEQIQ